MKTMTAPHKTIKSQLEIRFIPMDSFNPNVLSIPFSVSNEEMVINELNQKIGHLSHDIKKTHGYVNVFTLGNSIVGHPQFVNFGNEVWDKINNLHEGLDIEHTHDISSMDEMLDHENYTDV